MKTFKSVLLVVTCIFLASTSLSAQVLTLLHIFGESTGITNFDGEQPRADLVLWGDTLYGTTPLGGSNGYGTVFSVSTTSTNFTVLHSFTGGSDGSIPNKDLVRLGDTLYGLVGRGTNLVGYGALFSMDTKGGNFTIVYPFTTDSGGSIGQPNGGLIFSSNALYGTAYSGGLSNAGTIFSITTNGTFTLLHLFNSPTDGANPLGTLLLSEGTLYGTTRNGGTNGQFGTVFSLNIANNNFAVLHTFSSGSTLDGHNPDAGLVLSGSNLFGTTVFGGANNGGAVYSINTNGANYSIVHSFNPAAGEGKLPEAGLLLNGNTLYGTTLGNGSNLTGTIYSVNTDGSSFSTLYTFSAVNENEGDTNPDGSEPYDTLAMSGNILYGTTSLGGITGMGDVFSLAILPGISSASVAGTNLVLTASNGVAGESYFALASPSLSVPLSQWTPIATNALSSGGNFTFTATNAVNPSASQQFYTLKIQ
jgi:uncharacterized repeat protein (TIGR03803 family)